MTLNAKEAEFVFAPSPQDEHIKLIRKLRWIGMEKEAQDLHEWFINRAADERGYFERPEWMGVFSS